MKRSAVSLTDFEQPPPEIDKTDKTDSVSNVAFLNAVFAQQLENTCPVLVSFKGNPGQVSGKAWNGNAWKGTNPFAPEQNHYFSLASFYADAAGQYRRKKAQFAALYAVMLDDVGSKVAIERLTLAPSWLIETSPGNHQAGYLLDAPLTDGATADQLMASIIAAGLCDPGAGGPCARLARLPVACNGKHDPPFSCRLVEWQPALRYSVNALVTGLQLEGLCSGRPKREKSTAPRVNPSDEYTIWIPRPTLNPVLQALQERGLYKSNLGSGKHDLRCPWVDEHTDGIDNGTAYFEPNEQWPMGGFKCLHGHCAQRHIRDLLSELNIEPFAARMKPTIRLIAGDIHRVVDAAEYELAQSGRYYQRGGLVVTVLTDPGTRQTQVQPVSQNELVAALAGAAQWIRFDGRAQDWVRVDPPARPVAVLFDCSSYRHLPVLNGITRQPYLRSDGSLMVDAGYDAISGMFGVFDASAFNVVEHPTKQHAEQALAELDALLSEFCFARDVDRSAALAALFTAVIRPSLPVAPMFHVRAHTVGSGKSYLCELISAFAMPQRGTPTTFPADDEECRKLLLAELMRAPAVIEFDNLTSDLLAHKSLCTALTSEFMSGRILGSSKTATVSTRVLLLSSGNNVGPIQDMARRCITINLDPGMEIPAARHFANPNLLKDVLAKREYFVSKVLTIVRAWIVHGRPMAECRAVGSYGEWSDLCRQPLLWLGLPDPTESIFEALKQDPDRETLLRLLTAWYAVFGNRPAMVRDAVKQAHLFGDNNQELLEVLRDIADERGEINRRRLGRWIKRHSGRVVDGLRFDADTAASSSERWQVQSVSSVLSVSDAPSPKSVSNVISYARASRGE